MPGFGRSPFGHGPFGRSDAGQDLVVESFPVEYFSNQKDITKDELYHLLKVFANSVNKRREDIDNLPTIIDYEKAATEFVLLLGQLLGIGIDKNDPDSLQRSLLGNASQWLQIKGSTKGYQVRGLASGFAVEVDNFWKINPITVGPLIPDRFKFLLKPLEADPNAVAILHTDQPPGTFVGTPTVETPDYAKSSFLRLVFTIPPESPLNQIFTGSGSSVHCVDFNHFLDLVIAKITDVQAIHHELVASQFLTNSIASVSGSTGLVAFQEGFSPINFNVACYFDIIPADVMPTDMCLRANLDYVGEDLTTEGGDPITTEGGEVITL